MKIACLTSGPRGAGKSTYSALAKKSNQNIVILDRDRFYAEQFGSYYFDPYTGMHVYADKIFKQHIINSVKKAQENCRIIIDAWNGFPSERQDYAELLRSAGIKMLACWYFTTPLKTCLEWFEQKEEGDKMSTMGTTYHYHLYHEKAQDLKSFNYDNRKCAYFDRVYEINPLQLSLPNLPIL
jgi:predicted kinase